MRKLKGKILPIRYYGDKSLRKATEPVSELTEEIKQFIVDLTRTMYEKDGVGLSAPQVGSSLKIFIVDPFWSQEGKKKNPFVFINPKFLEFKGEISKEEGCLSFPEIYAKVNRAQNVVIEALNENWEKIKYEAEDLFSRVLQHEYDHLEGILFVDRVSKLKRIVFLKKLQELEKTTDENGVNIG